MKIKKGDNVEILTGKDAGRRGKVLEVFADRNRVVVEGLNILKKHSRPKRAGEKGQIIEFPGTVALSRVGLVCPHCQKRIRVAMRITEGGKKERYCRKCNATISIV